MTQTSAFHFESLVWDWPIAIYLFLIGISAGLVTLAVLLRRVYPQAGGADSTLLRTTLIVGPGAVILGLLILVFHLTRPWTFWKLMFHYSFTSVMSMGVMLFQLYMVVLVLWLAKIFEHDLLALQQRWLPKLGIVPKVLSLLTPVHRGLETLMLVLAIVTLMLSLLGTLIVRSGILVSVHAFALDNVRAVPLFSLFALISLASLALYGWRARDGGPAVRFSGLSREMLILATLLLFCAVLLIVLVGTLYPMIYGLLGWGRLSVGAPYFNRATLPFALLMLVVIVLATFVSGKRAQLPALLAHAGVLLFAAGIVVSSVSRQEISLNLQPGQQVTLAGYTFRFERLDLQAKGNYTSEKAIVALFDHQQRIGELTPERRFYEARRQQMMEPSIRWNGIHDWYAVMGEKTGADRYAFRLYVQSGVRWIWGGGLLMISGALLSGWRGRQRDE